MSLKKVKNITVDDEETVQLKECGNNAETTYIKHKNTKPQIIKINAEEYILCKTGEVKKFNRYKDRSDGIRSIKNSMKKLKDILNTNVTDNDKCRWVNLSYSDNMTEPKKLYQDFKNFNRRCYKKYGKKPDVFPEIINHGGKLNHPAVREPAHVHSAPEKQGIHYLIGKTCGLEDYEPNKGCYRRRQNRGRVKKKLPHTGCFFLSDNYSRKDKAENR